METGTTIPTAGDSGIGNLQRIQPTSNSGRRKRQTAQRPKKKKADAQAPPPELTYTPDGQVETDEHGLRIDISA